MTSPSRRLRREVARRRRDQESPRLLTERDGVECWLRPDGAIVVIPALREELGSRALDALGRRRRAFLDGTCACGARLDVVDKGAPMARATIHHLPGCMASDASLRRLGLLPEAGR